jgi:hypothetical protein
MSWSEGLGMGPECAVLGSLQVMLILPIIEENTALGQNYVFFFSLYSFLSGSQCIVSHWPWTTHVDQAGLQFTILLSPECWDYRHIPPNLAQPILFFDLWTHYLNT